MESVKDFRFRHSVDLLRVLVNRDLKIRYKRSALGMAWSLLNPILQLLVFRSVFQFLLPLNIASYTLFLFSGILVWTWFQSSLMGATNCIVDSAGLLRQPGFPAAVLPLVTITANLFHFVLALPVLVAASLFSGNRPTAYWVLPLIMAVQFAFTAGISYLTASLHVRFRDTQHLLGILLMLGFYLVPVFYTAASVPARIQPYYRLNPMVHIMDAYRSVLLAGSLPAWRPLAWVAGFSALLLCAAVGIFVRTSHGFVEEL
jgi:lipopolysaccharide transport system permease protein